MIKPVEELMESLRTKIGEDTSDEALALLEDVSDTLGEFQRKAEDTTDWETKYKENDQKWRQRYHDRFFNSETSDEDPIEEVRPAEHLVSFDDLFKKEG